MSHKNTICDLINKFREFGKVSDAPRSGHPCILMEDKLLDISDHMLESPGKSVFKLAQQTRLSYGSAY
jgi:hypothetical protein